jgi:hypothetical protein
MQLFITSSLLSRNMMNIVSLYQWKKVVSFQNRNESKKAKKRRKNGVLYCTLLVIMFILRPNRIIKTGNCSQLRISSSPVGVWLKLTADRAGRRWPPKGLKTWRKEKGGLSENLKFWYEFCLKMKGLWTIKHWSDRTIRSEDEMPEIHHRPTRQSTVGHDRPQ